MSALQLNIYGTALLLINRSKPLLLLWQHECSQLLQLHLQSRYCCKLQFDVGLHAHLRYKETYTVRALIFQTFQPVCAGISQLPQSSEWSLTGPAQAWIHSTEAEPNSAQISKGMALGNLNRLIESVIIMSLWFPQTLLRVFNLSSLQAMPNQP